MAQELEGNLFIIGGSQVYGAFLPYIEEWIVTEVPLTVEGADAFVPRDYLDEFTLSESGQIDQDLTVSVYHRKAAN